MIPDSTNVRVIADNIRKLKTEVENAVELPLVETTDEGKVLTVNSSGKWAALDLPDSIPKDYSTEETATGVKWIDGKYIYFKTISGTYPEITAATQSITLSGVVGTGLNIIDCLLTCVTTSGVQFLNQVFNESYNPTSGNFVLNNVPNTFSEGSYYLTIYYTKTPATRDDDTEPETKKSTKRKTTKGEN